MLCVFKSFFRGRGHKVVSTAKLDKCYECILQEKQTRGGIFFVFYFYPFKTIFGPLLKQPGSK